VRIVDMLFQPTVAALAARHPPTFTNQSLHSKPKNQRARRFDPALAPGPQIKASGPLIFWRKMVLFAGVTGQVCMIRITGLALPIDHPPEALRDAVLRR